MCLSLRPICTLTPTPMTGLTPTTFQTPQATHAWGAHSSRVLASMIDMECKVRSGSSEPAPF